MHGSNKTRIVYAANLNSVRAKKYLEFCVEMKMLKKEKSDGHLVYRTTGKGLRFLHSHGRGPYQKKF